MFHRETNLKARKQKIPDVDIINITQRYNNRITTPHTTPDYLASSLRPRPQPQPNIRKHARPRPPSIDARHRVPLPHGAPRLLRPCQDSRRPRLKSACRQRDAQQDIQHHIDGVRGHQGGTEGLSGARPRDGAERRRRRQTEPWLAPRGWRSRTGAASWT